MSPEAVAVPSWRAVFEGVTDGSVDAGVIAIENSLGGSIRETYDLLYEFQLCIVGEVTVPVRLALMALPGQSLDEIERVYSHPQGIAQADEFLRTRPWQVMTAYNTAGSAKMIRDRGEMGAAAVASARVAGIYGLEILASDVQTGEANHTRFAVLGPRGAAGRLGAAGRRRGRRRRRLSLRRPTGPGRCTGVSARSPSGASTSPRSNPGRRARRAGSTSSGPTSTLPSTSRTSPPPSTRFVTTPPWSASWVRTRGPPNRRSGRVVWPRRPATSSRPVTEAAGLLGTIGRPGSRIGVVNMASARPTAPAPLPRTRPVSASWRNDVPPR